MVWIPLFLDPSDGAFGRFDLAALCGCRTLNFCLFVLFAACIEVTRIRNMADPCSHDWALLKLKMCSWRCHIPVCWSLGVQYSVAINRLLNRFGLESISRHLCYHKFGVGFTRRSKSQCPMFTQHLRQHPPRFGRMNTIVQSVRERRLRSD